MKAEKMKTTEMMEMKVMTEILTTIQMIKKEMKVMKEMTKT
jgi:hypothetical protein